MIRQPPVLLDRRLQARQRAVLDEGVHQCVGERVQRQQRAALGAGQRTSTVGLLEDLGLLLLGQPQSGAHS
jgi:hypothetical protein